MSNPSIYLSTKKVEPELKDAFELSKKDIMMSLNCHAIGVIQSFNTAQQTASISIAYTKTFFRPALDGTPGYVQENYPLLIDVPVIRLGGGPFKFTVPPAQGDECLVLFNDRDIDNWFGSGQLGPVATPRLHSFADGFALVGISSLNSVIEDYEDDRAVLRSEGGARLGIMDADLLVMANETRNLRVLLQQLITQVQSLVTQTAAITVTAVTPGVGVSGVPVNAATITAISAQLTTTSNQIAELIE